MSITEYPDLVQGSDDWHDLRRGMVTASVVGKLVTVGPPDAWLVDCPACKAQGGGPCLSMAAKKEPTPIKTLHDARISAASEQPPVYSVASNDTSRAITLTLAAERIAGWTEDTPMTSDMWRGVESEPYAREVYSGHFAEAREIGFMVRKGPMPWDPNELVRPVDEPMPTWRLGYSPDGLVGDDGLIEIKAPRAKTHIRTILTDEVPTHYLGQCQAALLVSGREWCDFVSFVGGLALYRKRVMPDPKWFDAITAACIAFERDAAQIVADYETRVADLPQTERLPSLEMSL